MLKIIKQYLAFKVSMFFHQNFSPHLTGCLTNSWYNRGGNGGSHTDIQQQKLETENVTSQGSIHTCLIWNTSHISSLEYFCCIGYIL